VSENSCITVTEIDCDTAVLVEEIKTTVIDTTEPIVIVAACEQGPPGQDGAGLVEVASGPVSNGNTEVADSVLLSAARSVKWIVTITDSVAGDFKSYEVLAVHNGAIVLYSVYGIVGDAISVFTNVVVNVSSMELQLTNNSTNDLTIKVQRIATTV